MDIRQLRTFITFAEEKSMTKTSMRLNYAVSTLTEHVNALETEFGVKLLERRGRHMCLTKCGEVFLVYARKQMELYRDARREMSYFAGVEGLRIVTNESVALYTMPSIYTQFSRKYPDVEINVTIGNPVTFCDKLRSDEADIAFQFVWEPTAASDLESTILFQEEAVFVAPPSHYLARKRRVLPEDLDQQVFIFPQKDSLYREAIHQILTAKGLTTKSKLYMDSGSMIKKCVEMGHGLTLLPLSSVRDELAAGTLARLDWAGEPFVVLAQALILKKDWVMPAVREIIHLCIQTFQGRRQAGTPASRPAAD